MSETSGSTSKIPKPHKSFLSRNLVAIVMIPSIIGVHYGWSLLQENRTLVAEDEKKDLPALIFVNYCWNRLIGKATDKTTSPTGSPTE